MTWGAEGWLWALAAVPLLASWLWGAGRRHRSRLERAFSGQMLERVLPRYVRALRTIRDVLALAALALVVIALAEPRYGEKVVSVEQKGVDIVLALDLSRSMDARDVDPSRLERSRREILDLIGVLESDRVGLVVFAGAAYPRMPLTQDYDALATLVEELDTSVFQAQGSELGHAIRVGLKLLGSRRGEAGQAILVLSDGEIHRPADALAAASEAAAANVRIYGMGIGNEAAPIPMVDGSLLTDRTGGTVLTVPTPTLLTEVARITGGAYAQSVAAAGDMTALYREMRGQLEAREAGIMQRRSSETAFQIPLGLGLVMMLFASWIGDFRWRRVAFRSALMIGILALAPHIAVAASAADGDALYRSGRYKEAVDVFTELTLEQPTDPDLWGRLGAARYRAGDAEGAARAFDMQDRLSGGDAEAMFNGGNAHYRAHRLEEALEHYDRALELNPGHPGAMKNRELVQRELEARRVQKLQEDAPSQSGEGGQQSNQQAPQQGEQEQADGQAKGEQREHTPEQGEAQEGAQQPGERQQGQGRPGENGRQGQVTEDEMDEGEPGESTRLDALEGAEANAGDASATGGDASSQSMSEAQAERLLEGVEEGRPRVIVPSDATGSKPW